MFVDTKLPWNYLFEVHSKNEEEEEIEYGGQEAILYFVALVLQV
jgi:hypothetical protein